MDMDLFLLNKLSQLKDGPSSSGGGAGASFLTSTDDVVSSNDNKPIATVYSTNQRGSGPHFNWNDNFDNDAFDTYMNSSSSQIRAFFAPLGKVDMRSGNIGAYRNIEANSQDNATQRGIEFAGDRFVGSPIMGLNQNYNSSYSPFGARIIFLRNTSTSTSQIDISSYFSKKWQSGYDGAALCVYTPNSQNFTEVTDVGRDRKWSQSSDGWIESQSVSINIPARTTIAAVLINSFHNWTGFDNGEWTYNFNGFYNLRNMVRNGVECDLKATEAYAKMFDSSFQHNTEAAIVKVFNNIGRMYGNWEYS